MKDEPEPHLPWSCRWARFGGAVRASATVEPHEVFWICHHPTAGPRLFARRECERCERWESAGRTASGAAVPGFEALAPERALRLAGLAQLKRYERGGMVFAEGTPSRFFYTIASGRVKVFKKTPWGRAVTLELLGPGEPVGVAAACGGRAFHVSAVALDAASCVLVRKRALLGLLEQHPVLVRGLLGGLNHHLVEMMDRTVELSGAPVEARLAQLLLKLADGKRSSDPDRAVIDLSLTRRELAGLAGTTVETCIRVMSRWSKQGIVRTESDGATVVDRTRLQSLAAR